MKNMLSVVKSIATQSLRNVQSLDEAASTLTARIAAYAKAHCLLLQRAGSARLCPISWMARRSTSALRAVTGSRLRTIGHARPEGCSFLLGGVTRAANERIEIRRVAE
ncbi:MULTISPECIES: HWE histidine kinase domain-containing protein [unclassified Rhizobium]|uniref:HWE histidine kinase domain-containing protein n=1 Tax=Rhizobium sp. Leaf453 TaxID=1736380 RepID=UPI0009EC9561